MLRNEIAALRVSDSVYIMRPTQAVVPAKMVDVEIRQGRVTVMYENGVTGTEKICTIFRSPQEAQRRKSTGSNFRRKQKGHWIQNYR